LPRKRFKLGELKNERRKFMKFRSGILVLLSLLVIGIVVMAAQPIQLTFWGGWSGPDANVMRGLVDEYNSTHPDVHITFTTMEWTPLYAKFVPAAAVGNPPNIIAMYDPDLPEFASMHLLEPVGNAMKDAGFTATQFATVAWNETFYKGVQYAYPLDVAGNAIYYNKTLFEKAGIPLPPADEWFSAQQFLDMAIKLTLDKNGKNPNDPGFDPSNIVQYGFGLYSLNWHAFLQWYELLAQQGYSFLNSQNTKVDYPSEAGLKAWQWLQDLVFKYHVSPIGATSPLNDFLIGKTAMLEDGPWEITALQAQQGLEWGAFPVPQIFGQRADWGSGSSLSIPIQSDKTKMQAAEDFLTWLIKNSPKWVSSGNIPVYYTGMEYAKTQSTIAAFVNSVPYMVMLPNLTKGTEVFSAASVSPIVVAGVDIMVRDQEISPIMEWMNNQIDQILSR